ncbi:hypothetical protein BJY52DRAFT_1321793 [Lactarius psammicola]|nr:hypothetical protein BJY52DRAFT_1321793 [Lactarius psammicola]
MWSPQMGHLRVSARLARLTLGAVAASADVDATASCRYVSHSPSGSVARSSRARFLPRRLFSTAYASQQDLDATLRSGDIPGHSARYGFALPRGDCTRGCRRYGTDHVSYLRGERDDDEGWMLTLSHR